MGRKNNIEGQLSLFDMTFKENKRQISNQVEEKVRGTAAGSFPECASCWCATCEHSTVGGSVPRSFGDATGPCPSCELCVSEGKADVCVIGSAEEGCRYRAQKEGLLDETMDE